MAGSPPVSIVVPTLDEAEAIGPLLERLSGLSGPPEVIVVDGGSSDGTIDVVRRHPWVRLAQVSAENRGRGAQMDAGARLASGQVLLFLHADTLPPLDAVERMVEALGDPGVVAGNFAARFTGHTRPARFLTWLYPQLHRLRLVYGDSAIFVRSSAYRQVGGFRPHPIFEDVDLVRRLRRVGAIVHLASPVTTSSRRFEGRSFARTLAAWMAMQVLFWIGVSPRLLGRIYAPVRSPPAARAHLPD